MHESQDQRWTVSPGLKSLRPGLLVAFESGPFVIRGQVVKQLANGDWLIVSTVGDRFVVQPDECEGVGHVFFPANLAKEVGGQVRVALANPEVKRNLEVIAGAKAPKTAKPSSRRRWKEEKSPRGYYGDAKHGYVFLGGSVRGHLELWHRDIPLILTEGLTGIPTDYLCRLIEKGSELQTKEEQVLVALKRLEQTHRIRAEIFAARYMGVGSRQDDGSLLVSPMRPAEIAKSRHTSVQNVLKALRNARAQLKIDLRFDPLQHTPFGRQRSRAERIERATEAWEMLAEAHRGDAEAVRDDVAAPELLTDYMEEAC